MRTITRDPFFQHASHRVTFFVCLTCAPPVPALGTLLTAMVTPVH